MTGSSPLSVWRAWRFTGCPIACTCTARGLSGRLFRGGWTRLGSGTRLGWGAVFGGVWILSSSWIRACRIAGCTSFTACILMSRGGMVSSFGTSLVSFRRTTATLSGLFYEESSRKTSLFTTTITYAQLIFFCQRLLSILMRSFRWNLLFLGHTPLWCH